MAAGAKRELLLGAHRYQLGREDLEDCYSQATLELLAHVRGGGTFANRMHAANVLELRFVSRVRDRRRALAGRSPIQAALKEAVPFGGVGDDHATLVDRRADVERLVMLRYELSRIGALARTLSDDQQLLLACEVGLQMGDAEFRRRYGWTEHKYRKVAQRARRRLRALLADEEQAGEAQRDGVVRA